MNRTSIALLILGCALALTAWWGSSSLSSDAGDPDSVVRELSSPPSSTAPPSTEQSSESDRTPTEPRWTANARSPLGSVELSEAPLPVRLRIVSLAIDATIGAYGVDEAGEMDVPDNIAEVGWYKYGPRPGQPGSAVLAAHVDLRGPGRGLFWDLDKLEPGSQVLVEYSDGSELEFEVMARSIYLKDELPLDAIFSEEGPSVLTLVTCGGGFSWSERSYDSNVVVYAVPVGSVGIPVDAS